MSSSSQSTLRQQRQSNQLPSSTRHSKITVEYHRPSRESIQEYGALLDQANLQAAAANLPSFIPSRQAPPPPSVSTSSIKQKDPSSANPPQKVRNSLQKPPPRGRKPSLQTTLLQGTISESNLQSHADFDHANLNSNVVPTTPPPARPARDNTTTLNDLFHSQTTLDQRRISTPVIKTRDPAYYADPAEPMPPLTLDAIFSTSNSSAGLISSSSMNGSRLRNSTANKGKKGMLGFMSELLNSSKRPEISTPYDPVHLTHVGFNTSTGEFTGLPKEWQLLLQESGISRTEQEKNPEAVFEIVKFYQEGGGDVWDKMGAAMKNSTPSSRTQSPQKTMVEDGLHSPVSIVLAACLSTVHAFLVSSAPPPPLPRSHMHLCSRRLRPVVQAQMLLPYLLELLLHRHRGLLHHQIAPQQYDLCHLGLRNNPPVPIALKMFGHLVQAIISKDITSSL
jgi:p21-activated kinase 1